MEERIEQDDTPIDRDYSGNKRHREENFPGEEWFVIEEGEDGKNVTSSSRSVEHDNGSSSSELSYSDIDYSSDAEEAREMPLAVLSEEDVQVGQAEERMTIDAPSASKNDDDPILSGDKVALQIAPKRNRANIFKEVATCVNLLIACSMVIAIGIGLGLKSHEAHRMSQHLDYATMKMENDRLLEQIKQLTSAKEILDEIKPVVIRPKIIETSEFRGSQKDQAEESLYPKKRSKAQHRSSHRRLDVTPLARLENSLSTICSILGDVHRSETATFARPSSTRDSRSMFSDLSTLRVLLDNVITEMDDSTKSTNHKFFTNIDFQIDSVSESLAFELARSLDKANAKKRRKVRKIVEKVNERLCMLRNTMSSDNKLKLFLDANNTFLENCENISASRKLNERIKEKRKNEKENSTLSGFSPDNPINYDSYEISDSDMSRRQNATKSARGKATCRQSAWQTRKCCNNDLNDGISGGSKEKEETCSALMAPPRSTSKTIKRPTPPPAEFPASRTTEGSKNGKPVRRKESTTKGSFRRLRLKGNDAPSKRAKIKNRQLGMSDQKHDESKKRQRNDLWMKNGVPSRQPSSRSFSTGVSRNNEVERKEREKLADGDWQFARSRFRDQLRKDESTENWYFNRAGNRKFSRSNRNEASKEEPR